MVTISKKAVDGKSYYYLEHSYREKGKVIKKEKYLGKNIPKDIDKIKQVFLEEIYKKKWFKTIDTIKKKYREEFRKTPITAREKERKSFAVRFTYDTQRIEGSKLTLRETANLLERGITPREKPLRDVKEAEAHEKIFLEMLKTEKNLSFQLVLYWHKKLLENKEIAGKIRKHQITISGSKFMPPFPAEVDLLLREFFKWYNKNKDKMHSVELAALAHLKFVTIHPFADGNGRISRLIMNFILNKKNHPMLDIHYEGRTSYYNALERSQTKKQENIFVQWLFKRYIKENKKYTTKK